ncbi:nitroreductase family protein [Derxia gummosa]|uniref:Nitroreductase family protein n=1 Tax=Derxia gummosa DSM 723 TaxID=1121388 RepID=A0A8B6X8X5_9BURK|nr:nitroreductase family protein [Derxia gummosa]
MRWDQPEPNYWQLSSELIFQYHKLEKGMCMPGKPRFFGEQPALDTIALVERWRAAGFPLTDPVYLGAMEGLRGYRERIRRTPPKLEETAARIFPALDRVLSGHEPATALATPMPFTGQKPDALPALTDLCHARRSVRAYADRRVNLADVREALALAQLSPSACNRQPWIVHAYQQREKIDSMLELQNGNGGFGKTIPLLLVICVEARAFFDGSERNEPYVDAGLFTMSLLLALQARGLSSCCLNWCVEPDTDREAHRRGQIPESEKIIMYLAVGYPEAEAVVPRSARRGIDSFLKVHA